MRPTSPVLYSGEMISFALNIGDLRRLKALAFDVGDKNRFAPATRELDAMLRRYYLGHEFEEYGGTHVNRIAQRIETKALPFFTGEIGQFMARSARINSARLGAWCCVAEFMANS